MENIGAKRTDLPRGVFRAIGYALLQISSLYNFLLHANQIFTFVNAGRQNPARRA